MKKILTLNLILILFTLGLFLLAAPNCQADTTTPPAAGAVSSTSPTGTVSLDNPIGTTSLPVVIGRIINAVLGFIGAIALLMFVYGGVLMLTSAGNSAQVTKGKSVLIWAVIGLAVIIFSYTLANFVITAITGGATGGGSSSGGGAAGTSGDKACTDWGGTCQDIGSMCGYPITDQATRNTCIKEINTTSKENNYNIECIANKCSNAKITEWNIVCCK